MKININFVNGAFCEILDDNNKNKYYVQFINKETNEILHDGVITSNMWIKSSFSYFINYRIRIIDFKSKNLIHEIDYNATSKNVFIWFDSNSLGDNISWIPFVEEFRLKHNCTVYCSTYQNEIFKSIYPHIKFVEPGKEVHNLYASYSIGCFNDESKERKNWKLLNNQEICANILGIDYKEIKPPLKILNSIRPIKQKYVCISTKSTAACKEWNAENGWKDVVSFLNSKGYKVVLVQKEEVELLNDPKLDIILCNSTDLNVLINMLYNCEFYIGLSSGVSWLSWSLNKPSILISGMSLEKNEFFTPFRIINKNVCHGCWNNPKYKFDRGDWFWCPKLKDTDRQFECSKSITSQTVIDNINTLIKHEQTI